MLVVVVVVEGNCHNSRSATPAAAGTLDEDKLKVVDVDHWSMAVDSQHDQAAGIHPAVGPSQAVALGMDHRLHGMDRIVVVRHVAPDGLATSEAPVASVVDSPEDPCIHMGRGETKACCCPPDPESRPYRSVPSCDRGNHLVIDLCAFVHHAFAFPSACLHPENLMSQIRYSCQGAFLSAPLGRVQNDN